MFGQDDNQPSGQTNSFQAAMPDPLPPAPSAPIDPTNTPWSPPAPAAPAQDLTTPELPSAGTPDEPGDSVPVSTGSTDLQGLKQQALQQLSPLVSHLDQTPEEKFRTTMMMIQASDDQALIKEAFEAAQKIQDDKARAQALLDVINEINYFTQHQDQA